MLSTHTLGHVGPARDGPDGATAYYERSTRPDHLAVGRDVPDETRSMGVWHTFGPHAPADLDGARLTPDDMRDALAGDFRGQRVRNAHDPDRQIGLDLAFSLSKPESIQYGAADRGERERMDRDMEAAAVKAVREIIAPELTTRTGEGGRQREAVSIAANFYLQHFSRDNDPQLHVHVIVPNLGWSADGKVRTVELRWAYEAQRAAGMAFEAEFLNRMCDRGYQYHLDHEGVLRARGVDERLEAVYSKRRDEVDTYLADKLKVDPREATSAQRKMAQDATRRDKPHELDADRLREHAERWPEEARTAGLALEWERARAEHLAARERAGGQEHEQDPERDAQRNRELDRAADESIRDLILGTQRSAVTLRDEKGNALVARHALVAEIAARARGIAGGVDDVLRAVQRAEDRGGTVTLEQREEHRASLRDRFSTPGLVEIEHKMLDQWRELASRTVTGHGVEVPDRLLLGLSQEQQAAVRAMTADRQVSVIEGLAGVGKTTVLARARAAHEEAGFRVLGEAHAGVASQELFTRAGIREARTIALSETRERVLDHQTALIVDEVQNASSLQHARLIDDACRTGCKLILVGNPGRAPQRDRERDPGDPGQHGPVGPGAPARHLAEAARELVPEATSGMREIQRQRDPELRRIAELAATGYGDQALAEADKRGWLTVTNTSEQMREHAARYIADARRDGVAALAVVGSRQEMLAVNTAARSELRARGMLGEDDIRYRLTKKREFLLAPGERVRFERNDYDLAGTRTGQRAEIIAADRATGELLLRLDAGTQRADRDGRPITEHRQSFHDGQREHRITDPSREMILDRSAVEQLVRGRELLAYDYARTSAKAQSATLDRVAVCVHHESRALSKQFAAVALTRSREELRIIVSAQGIERERDHEPTGEDPHWPRDAQRADGAEQQRLFVDPSIRKQALEEAGARLGRDSPGETTLSYPDAPERAREARERERAHREGRELTREPVATRTAARDGAREHDHDDARAERRGEEEPQR